MAIDEKQPKICPYPGLRPFTEEESIFFKGRDLHIQQIITQLEAKKFVMLTGASGDGKSSVVYAGVVPNVRAGFFKAKFNKWVFVDFKPGRSPLKNMVGSLADHLSIENEKVENRLKSGFSSLIEVYKSSQYYLDTESESYVSLDEKGKKELKRKAANLFILVDQFEEFFTNSENFSQGKPSLDSQLVVNILLETARIAIEKKLPIYIIFTMRSDFIGQCAAFRGLPEYIGFSQFFVPRLKRKEIYEVIEEPVKLSDNSISRRLLETLIDELHEGFDQLPVLQHALNQIWTQAEKGEKEMDLLHLAKLSGLPASYLPEKDQDIFREWYENVLINNSDIKEVIEKDFGNPSLENVLNTHANELYNSAAKYYVKNHPDEEEISVSDSRQIIKTAFQCLTKIDASRAVRIRMTLKEITDIINLPQITSEKVGGILNIFREQGNTFISPFILSEKPDTIQLQPDTVLDITHESLIRNWDLLHKWAREENDNWQNFLDFNKQLQRWINSEKSGGYMLPIGPLTFFENWFNRCKPNKYWLVKYDESDNPIEEKLQNAEETVNYAREFLKRSARRLFVSRTILKYGAQRIAAILGLVFLVSAITYYTIDFRIKQNDYVLEDITKKSIELMPSKFIKSSVKAKFLVNYERMHPGSFTGLLDQLADTLAYDVAVEAFKSIENLSNVKKSETNPMVKPLALYIVNSTEKFLTAPEFADKEEFLLNKLNSLVKLYLFINCWDKEMAKAIDIKKFMKIQNQIINSIIKHYQSDKNYRINNISVFNHAIDLQLCLNDDQEELSILIRNLSPFEEEIGRATFNAIYPKEKRWGDINSSGDLYTHNGGFQILSYLYASVGDYKKIQICQDSVMKNSPNYFQFYANSITDLISCLIKFNYFPSEKGDQLIREYSQKGKLNLLRTADNIRTMVFDYQPGSYLISTKPQYEGSLIYLNINNNDRIKIQEYYLDLLKKESKTTDDLNFNLALYYKKLGTLTYRMNRDTSESYQYFKRAFNYYADVNEKYLSQNYVLGNEGTIESRLMKNSIMFLYPLNFSNSNYWNPYYFNSLSSYPMIEFLIAHPEDFKYYKQREEAQCLQQFLLLYYNNSYVTGNRLKINKAFDFELFNSAYSKAKVSGITHMFSDTTIFKLIEIEELFGKDSIRTAFKKYSDFIIKDKTFPDAKMFDSEDYIKQAYNSVLSRLSIYIASNDYIIENNEFELDIYKDIFKIVKSFPQVSNKRNTLIDIIIELQKRGPVEKTFSYLDSLFIDIDKTPKYGKKLFKALGMIGSKPINDLSLRLMKDVKDDTKPYTVAYFIQGVCYTKNYYQASIFIPDYFSSMNEMEMYIQILHAANLERSFFSSEDLWADNRYEFISLGDGGYETEQAYDYVIYSGE